MVGEEILFTHVDKIEEQELMIEVEHIAKRGAFEDISISVRKGEILGIAGMVGSGRTEVARALAGIETVDEGRIIFKGEEMQNYPFSEYIKRGICLVPEDRDLVGLIAPMNVAGNITLASLKKLSCGPLLRLLCEREVAEKYVRVLNIATQGIGQKVKFLSGGNRQKVMLAKWLAVGMELFLMDEPTQGVDVGAREEIHHIMQDLVHEGKSVIMITSDLDELMNMSHRIIVMSKGQIVARLDTSQTTQEEVLSFAIGKSA
jgi:ABC-type sugar transport system ATPase subunit